MKKFKNIIIFFSLFFLLPSCNVSAVDEGINGNKLPCGGHVILEGEAEGLIDSLDEKEPFLISENMLPGDIVTRSLIIRNNFDYSYKMTLQGKRMYRDDGKGYDYDLMNKIRIKIYYEGEENNPLYNDFLFDEAEDTKTALIQLGTFKPGDSRKLNFEATLDKKVSGNDYMNKYLLVDTVFNAERVEEDYVPKNTLANSHQYDYYNKSGNYNKDGNYNKYKGVAKTGDKKSLPYVIICGIALAVIICGIIYLFVKKNKEGKKHDNEKK